MDGSLCLHDDVNFVCGRVPETRQIESKVASVSIYTSQISVRFTLEWSAQNKFCDIDFVMLGLFVIWSTQFSKFSQVFLEK